jgi:phosphoribosylamine--glycine ligase
MVLGVGAFTQGVMRILRDSRVETFAYLTRPYGHFPPSLEGTTFSFKDHPDPTPLLQEYGISLVIPMSIEWIHRPWRDAILKSGVPFLCPTGEALLLERDRDFAHRLCAEAGIPFPRSHVARTKEEAIAIVRRERQPFVIKNPLCSPTSPIHTIVCETVEDTLSWLERIDYGEGVFLQAYMGRAEAGHIALVSNGEIYSLVTNQEYKRAFNGNMGIVAGAPLGGISEQDPGDKYGLAKELLQPLIPWFKKTQYHGPVQVTAALHHGRWHVLEYNVRLGVTNGMLLLRMLENPYQVLSGAARNLPIEPAFKKEMTFGCSVTLAGFGYPYVSIEGPPVLLQIEGAFDTDVWWNEVGKGADGNLLATGHRIADVNAWSTDLGLALNSAYSNIEKIRCLGSYYRTDVGKSLWPPGTV